MSMYGHPVKSYMDMCDPDMDRAEDNSEREQGYICPNQFTEDEHDSITDEYWNFLGYFKPYEDIEPKAQEIANFLGRPIEFQYITQNGRDWEKEIVSPAA